MNAPPNLSSTAALRIAQWAANLNVGDVSPDVIAIAQRCLVDLFAVGMAGASQPVAVAARTLAIAEHGNGSVGLFGDTRRTTASGAAFANAVAAHALDFDDTCYAGITHGTAVIGPAVLAAADHANASGETLLAGFIAGSEAAYGLGKATGNSVYFRGWWGTTVYGAIGAAVGAARVFNLTPEQTAAAIGLATLGTGGLLSGLGTDAKPLTCGTASAAGLRAALLAAAGATGPLGILEGARGFAQVFNDGVFDASKLNLLGDEYSLLTPGIFIKPFPTCTATHAALEALHQMMNEHALRDTDIIALRCRVPNLVAISLVYDTPDTPQQAQFSMPFTLAWMLVHGALGTECLAPTALDIPAVRAAMARVSMIEDDDLTARSETGAIGPECAQVEIETTDGRRFELFNSVVTGAPDKPMSDQALDDKFHTLMTQAGLEKEAARILADIRSCGTLKHASELWPSTTVSSI